jgi:hypothetical protein
MAHIDRIFYEARLHNWNKVRDLIIKYNVVDEMNNDLRELNTGNTLLHRALSQGDDIKIIKELITYIDVNAINNIYITPLTTFIFNLKKYKSDKETEEIMKYLLDNGADPMFMPDADVTKHDMFGYGCTPYLIARQFSTPTKLLDMMEKKGANLNYVKKMYSRSTKYAQDDY